MSTGYSSCYQALEAMQERVNYNFVFESAMNELSGKVDLSWVKSCVALGIGDGKREIMFARHLLPNLKTLVAVDPDHESVKALRASIQVVVFIISFQKLYYILERGCAFAVFCFADLLLA